jgi:hypothetical protein
MPVVFACVSGILVRYYICAIAKTNRRRNPPVVRERFDGIHDALRLLLDRCMLQDRHWSLDSFVSMPRSTPGAAYSIWRDV